MSLTLYALGVAVLLSASFFYLFGYRSWRRRRVMAKPFPADWQTILDRDVWVYRHLPEPLQARLRPLIQVFLDEKRFYGCAGLTVTDTMRVTIAAEACLLILNLPLSFYDDLRAILVYPSAYRVPDIHREGEVLSESSGVHLGDSWQRGKVILSWEDVVAGAGHHQHGHNVAIHEFTHQLDQADGSADGAPMLRSSNALRTWSQVFSKAFDNLQKTLEQGHSELIDPYGATNPAEFFAVVTETFFERPRALHREHPALYRQLQQFFDLDPLSWTRAGD
ncbi:M90 family metallopeptidase [Mangrovitalea sediminis]|uniref:M90 family metallopeptidase n=1 Tax=Mangrovitalea sediminis TaxID=1982043 RepID=UPI000BE57F1F|nr:M90 family metallopeptidase [Mangrovitalea sediminis]